MVRPIWVTSLVLVPEEAKFPCLAFKAAIVLYVPEMLGMGANVLVFRVVGRHPA